MTYKIDFTDPPAVGHKFYARKRFYKLLTVEPYIRKSDGVPSWLLTWGTVCPGCKKPFTFLTGMRKKGVNAHCPPCVPDKMRALGLAAGERMQERKRILDDLMG